MELIGSGTGRTVFTISDELVLKVSRNEAGRRQNEVEVISCDNSICANIYQHDENYLWCIMERVYPITEEDFDILSGTTREDRMVWYEYKYSELGHLDEETNKFIEARYKSMAIDDGWVDKMNNNNFSRQLVNMLLFNNLEAGDLIRHDSWGISKDNPDKPILFDYGLSHSVWIECYKRHTINVKYEKDIIELNAVEVIDELDKPFIKINVNNKSVIVEKVIIT
jgi:hypothetical protein